MARNKVYIGKLRYIEAADPAPTEDAPQKADPGLKDLLKDFAPAKEEAPKPTEEQQKQDIVQQQLLKTPQIKNLEGSIKGLVKKTYKLLDKYGIKHRELSEYYEEEDGVDLVVDIDPGAFVQPVQMLFDWTTGWRTRMVEWLKDPATERGDWGTGNLNEVILDYCKQQFIANNPTGVKNLLTAVSTLQKVDSRPRNPSDKPDPTNSLDKLEWSMEVVRQMMSRKPEENYADKTVALKVAQQDEEAGNFEAGTAKTLADILQPLTPEGWKKMVEELSNIPKGSKWKSSLGMIQKAVAQLTQGKYKARMAISYDEDGSIIAVLRAPFPLIVRFRRVTRQIQFQEVATEICDRVFVTSDPKLASALVFANVNLGIAAKNVANEQVSKDRSGPKRNLKELVDEFADEVGQAVKELSKKDQEIVLRNLEETATEQFAQKPPYGELASVIMKDPDAFYDFVTKHKDQTLKYFKANPAFLQWLKKSAPKLFTKLDTFITQEGKGK